MRRLLKALIQFGVANTAPLQWRMSPTPRLLVLMYHRVLPDEHPDRASEEPGMYVTPATLAMHLRAVKRHFEIVHLDDWVKAANANKPIPKLSCAITFDDGWLDNYEHAFPVLKDAATPATIFLVSEQIDTRYEFWPNRLARYLKDALTQRGTIPDWLQPTMIAGASIENAIDHAIRRCKDLYTDEQMNTFLNATPPSAEHDQKRNLMNWDEAREMNASGLVRFGSHSCNHIRLQDRLDDDVLETEVTRSRMQIENHLKVRPTLFCYPNGDYCTRAIELVRANYLGAVTTARGWNTPTSEMMTMNRVGVHEDVSSTSNAFIARIAGVG